MINNWKLLNQRLQHKKNENKKKIMSINSLISVIKV